MYLVFLVGCVCVLYCFGFFTDHFHLAIYFPLPFLSGTPDSELALKTTHPLSSVC